MRLLGAVTISLILHAILLTTLLSTLVTNAASSLFSFENRPKFIGAVLLVSMQTMRNEIGLRPPDAEAQAIAAKNTNTTAPVETAEEGAPINPVTNKTLQQQEAPALPSPKGRYYLHKEVDRPARMIDNISDKDGPLVKALRETNEQGHVALDLWINDRGWVDQIVVIDAALSNIALGIIRDHIDRVRFLPARLNHQPVNYRITIEIQFDEIPTAGGPMNVQ